MCDPPTYGLPTRDRRACVRPSYVWSSDPGPDGHLSVVLPRHSTTTLDRYLERVRSSFTGNPRK